MNKDFTPNRYQTREENELKTKQMREVKRKEYLEKIVKSENNRDFQSSDHANAIGGDGTVTKYYENVDIREVSSTQNQYEILLDGKPLKSPKRRAVYITEQVVSERNRHGMGDTGGRFDSAVYHAVDAVIVHGVGSHERLRDV